MEKVKLAAGTRAPTEPTKESRCQVNSRTVVGGEGGVFSRQPLSGPIALSLYQRALRQRFAEEPRDRVFLAVVDSDGSRLSHCVLAPGESIIFGRHEQARLQHSSQDISLRHVAIAVAPSSTAEAPLLRVWDLATGRPFQTEDGVSSEAVTADGPVFASIGSVYLAIIPLSSLPSKLPIGTRDLWESMPPRDFISRIAQGSAVQPLRQSMPAADAHITHVTRIEAAQVPEDCEPDLSVATLAFKFGQHRRSYRISMDALNRGILIGRYERCLNAFADLDRVSRVHLLISRIGQDIVAIDTASTHGAMRSMNRAFETAVLADRDKIVLADTLLLKWHYQRPLAT